MRNTFRVSGRVIDRKNRTGVANLRVEAWDKDLIFDDFVGKADTDAEGRFQIEFKESYFSEIFLDRRPDLFFKIFLDNDLVASTEGSVLWNVCSEVTELTIAVDTPKRSEQAPEKPFVVKGTIRSADGKPWACGLARAFDKDMRSEELLGETRTDTKGLYEIRYTARTEKDSANLIIRALDPKGTVLAASPVVFNAGPVEEINLTLLARLPSTKLK